MLKVRASVPVAATPQELWKYVSAIDQWWTSATPDHRSLVFLSETTTLVPGTRTQMQERIAGFEGNVTGAITEVVPLRRVVWESETARYRYLFLTIPVQETVAWEVRDTGEQLEFSMRLHLSFAESFFGTLCEWCFVHIFRGTWHLVSHMERELSFIAQALAQRS